jgi:hypothetical protein
MSDIHDLAAHLDEFDGTLVHRGTPVEKHCRREKYKCINLFPNRSRFERC